MSPLVILEEEFEVCFSRTAEREGFSVLGITSNTFKMWCISVADKVNPIISVTITNNLHQMSLVSVLFLKYWF